ncbi:MAG TPA: (S)-ureidoglycine aminohydrolase [Tepidisphaeraceae bacterium]
MRPLASLVHSRTCVRPRFALMPLEGFPFSRLPSWPDAQVRVLASPALGAKFVEHLIDLPAGKSGEFAADDEVQTFYYVTAGAGKCESGGQTYVLRAGSFGLAPPQKELRFTADASLSLILIRKKYVPATGIPVYAALHGHESDVVQQHWNDNPHALLQTLIPDEFEFDMAMNIFTFSPGHGLPIVETHVMEHGAFMLQGKGLYYLGEEWMEVEKNDFIYMAPFCPQSFYATGPQPASYIYYKDVNREIAI